MEKSIKTCGLKLNIFILLHLLDESVIIQNTRLTSNIDKIRLIQRVFARNGRIWQRNVAICLAKRYYATYKFEVILFAKIIVI